MFQLTKLENLRSIIFYEFSNFLTLKNSKNETIQYFCVFSTRKVLKTMIWVCNNFSTKIRTHHFCPKIVCYKPRFFGEKLMFSKKKNVSQNFASEKLIFISFLMFWFRKFVKNKLLNILKYVNSKVFKNYDLMCKIFRGEIKTRNLGPKVVW